MIVRASSQFCVFFTFHKTVHILLATMPFGAESSRSDISCLPDFALLQHLRRSGKYCDLVIQSTVNDSKRMIPCHKIVLVTMSPFFKHELEKIEDQKIPNMYIEGVDEETLISLIEYMYSGGGINVTTENVFKTYTGAQHFRLQKLSTNCMQYIQGLASQITQVATVLKFAVLKHDDELIEECVRFILPNFQDFKCHGFFDLDSESVKLLTQHQLQGGLVPPEDILKSVIEWLHFDEERRKQYAFDLVKDIPLTKISLQALRTLLREDSYVQNIPAVFGLYVDTLEGLGRKLEKTISRKKKKHRETSISPESDAGSSKRGRVSLDVDPTPKHLSNSSFGATHTDNDIAVFKNYADPNVHTRRKTRAIAYFVAHRASLTKSVVAFDLESKGLAVLGVQLNFDSSTSLIYHNRKIYSLGGVDTESGSRLNLVSVFNVDTKVWEAHAPNHVRVRDGFKSIVLGDYLYAVGGLELGITSGEVERLNIRMANQNWNSVSRLPFTCFSFGICVVGGRIYVLGGSTSQSASKTPSICDTVASYSPAVNKWSMMKKMPVAKSGLAVATIGKYIYAMGGCAKIDNKTEESVNTVDLYDIRADSWSSGVPMNHKRWLFSAVVYNSNIYVFGGDSDDTPTMERFDVERQAWVDMGALPSDGLYHSVELCTN